jgi:hypothetical protein
MWANVELREIRVFVMLAGSCISPGPRGACG